jgi:hypothetical protein
MKIAQMRAFLLISVFSLFLAAPALCQQADIDNLEAFYSTAIDKMISNCQNKSDLKHSKSEQLRRTAALSCMKAAYLKEYKNLLIREMIQADIGTQSYKIRYFLNERFFDVIQPQLAKLN